MPIFNAAKPVVGRTSCQKMLVCLGPSERKRLKERNEMTKRGKKREKKQRRKLIKSWAETSANYNYLICICRQMCAVCWSFSHVWLFATLWIVAHQAPQSMGFSRQEYLSGLPWEGRGLPDPETKPASPMSPALQVGSLPTEPPRKPICRKAWLCKLYF